MGQIPAKDTAFRHPVFSSWPPSSVSGDTPLGGRLMSESPHLDGLIYIPAEKLAKDSANLVLTRNAKGDWSLNRTSAGAETYHVRGVPGGIIVRTGERYFLEDFPNTGGFAPAAPNKGVSIRDVFVCFNVGVVALTSANLRIGSSQYEAPAPLLTDTGAAIVQTDIVAATSVLPTALTTASQYVTQLVPNSTFPAFVVTDITLLELELTFVMANTGTVQVAGIGAHVNFNYD